MSDLPKRLRDEACGGRNWNAMLNGAADLIEAQAKEIAELREQVFWLKSARPNIAVVAENERMKALCDQMGAALEETVSDSHAALEYMREAYGDRLKSDQDEQAEVCKQADDALTAWREAK